MRSNDVSAEMGAQKMPLGARLFLRLLQRISVGALSLTDPAGEVTVFGHAAHGLHAQLTIRDWRAAHAILRRGDIGFADSLKAGWAESPDMVALFTLALRNEAAVDQAVQGRWWALVVQRLRHLILRDNSRRGSRRNILSHYDLGNDFYAQWLDAGMTYSSALFDGNDALSLAEAQDAKYDRILDELDARPGQTVLEIGCGWGGFAERAALRGLNVHGITLSDAQLAWARDRMSRQRLNDRVTLDICDYRDLPNAAFDHIVSIEMVEAVGERRWPLYFKTLARCLKPGGRIVVQSIDIDNARFDAYRRGTDFIQQYVFPGGMLPSPAAFEAQVAATSLKVLNVKAFGVDYAETLKRWRVLFDARVPTIMAQGFDDTFIRIWRMYLAYCEAGFREGRTDVRQWTLG